MRQSPVSRNGFWKFATTILILATLLQGCASAPGIGAVTIVQSSLPNGRVNAPYSVMLTATGGVAPYNWAIASGALPSGLTLNATTGLLSGTPTQSSEMLVNGAPNATWDMRSAYSAPQDAVQEVSVKVLDTDAGFGHTRGGTINQVLRSGTNSLHGDLYSYFRNQRFNAANPR